MGNLGEITEIVNASELTLELGADTYILLTNLNLHIGRTEDRIATTDGGALYTYGKYDSWFTATLLVSTPELNTINALNILTDNGDMPSQAWIIRAKNVAGASKTFSATGILREYDISKPVEGKVSIEIFVRLTGDTVTISG